MTTYLYLTHGRNHPSDELNDWGFDGPILGPIDGIHVTYQHHIRIFRDGDECGELRYIDDLLYYDGKYYGDWGTREDPISQSRIELPDPDKFDPNHKPNNEPPSLNPSRLP